MTIDLSQFYQVFFDEAGEHLGEMESLLLELDVDQPDLEMLNAIFRAAHSIKGGAGTFGFQDMAKVTHVLETLLDRLRKQELHPTAEMVDAFLDAGDVLGAQLAAHREEREYEDERIGQVCARLQALSEDRAPTAGQPSSGTGEPAEGAGGATTDAAALDAAAGQTVWRIAFDPAQAGFDTETPPLADSDSDAGSTRNAGLNALAEALAERGSLTRGIEASGMPVIWRLSTDTGREELLDLFDFVCDASAIEMTAVSAEDAATAADSAPGADRAIEEDPGFGIFADAPGATQAVDQEHSGYGLFGGSPGMERVASTASRDQQEDEQGYGLFDPSPGLPAGLNATATATTDGAAAASGAGEASKSAAVRRPAAAETSIRVSVDKVDQLINLVGELVITHAMLAESGSGLDPVEHEKIFGGLSNLERNSRDLQQAVMSIRMMPISFVFNRFPRVVRDTANTMQKKVTLTLIGEDTELDKGLIERLADPLNHLVRNSIDHGIEAPAVRLAAGKPETGEITLRASHQGGNIIVEVRDDGAGLDRKRLLAKAAERGVPMADNPSDKEVWQLIFAAGFSTAAKVTDISGRGVGMDVVRRNIEQMNGRVEIDSALGQGTRITIRLPLTLAILDGMSVRLGQEIFILPLTAIRESIQSRREQFKSVAGQGQVFQVGGEYLPLVILQNLFHQGRPRVATTDGVVVIVDTHEGRAALLVDELVAQHQVVIKSLETNYRKVEGVSGATIMGDGRVALILDVDELVRLSQQAPGPQPLVEAQGTPA